MAYTTANLVTSIKRKSFAPTGQRTFQTSDLLQLADEQMLAEIVPHIMSLREEYLVTPLDYTITADKNAYRIPDRAVGAMVREIWIVDGTSINSFLPRLEPERINSSQTGTPEGFYLQNNEIILWPTPNTTAKTLRVFFYLHPAEHVETTDAAKISSINTSTNVITVASIPNSWSTGDEVDLIRGTGVQEALAIDQTTSSISGTDITLSSLPSELKAGDYVALAGYTPLPQIPKIYRPILAQAVAAEILEDMNQPGASKARDKLNALKEYATKMLTPRVHGADRVIVGNNWLE